ncbi:uncharacterized protein [Diadema antillarum]|uniref:uncharacterized protein isoform X2 n=1 Tax=Diadema antillarum TaxID=105358 RepID=UPI003A89EFF7
MLHPALSAIPLVVSVGLVAPVVADIQQIYAPKGTTTTLSCPCISSEAETVWYWYKSATLIASSFSPKNDRYVLSEGGHNLTITLTNNDNGTYECRNIHECTKKFNVIILAVSMDPCMDPAGRSGCDCFLDVINATEITCTAHGFPSRPTIHFTSGDENPIASIPSSSGDLWSSTAVIEPTSLKGNRVVTCSASAELHFATMNVCLAAPPPAIRMEPCGNPGGGNECTCNVDATEEIDITCTASGFLDRPTIHFANSEGHPIPSVSSSTDSNEWSAVATIEPILTTENRVVSCSASSDQHSATISACLVSPSSVSLPDEKGKGLGPGGIVGILIGVILILLIIIGIIAYIKRLRDYKAVSQTEDRNERWPTRMTCVSTVCPWLVTRANSSFRNSYHKEDKDYEGGVNDNEILPDDQGEPLIIQILRDNFDTISTDIERQNCLIDNVKGILREFETGRTTQGSSARDMMHSSKCPSTGQAQRNRIRRLLMSTKIRVKKVGENSGRQARDKCELRISQCHIEPTDSDLPEQLDISQASFQKSDKCGASSDEYKSLYGDLSHILTRDKAMYSDELYRITQFILDAFEQDTKHQSTNNSGSSLSSRYTSTEELDPPTDRITRFWVEKIMNICDRNIQYHVFTSICNYA